MSSEVQVSARHHIRCADATAVAALESPFRLGALDALVFPFVPIANAFVYRKPVSNRTDEFIPINRLCRTLPHLLNHYPHLTGRLRFNPDTGAAEIERLGTGAELLEAHCDIRLDNVASQDHASGRILLTNLPDDGNALTPPFDSSIEGACRDPILAIQHTKFACGGVALGIRLHHIVCDADGFFQLVRDIATLYRALATGEQPTLAEPPVIISYLRDLSALSPEEVQEAREYKSSAFYLAGDDTKGTEAVVSNKEPRQEKPQVLGRTVRFSGNSLKAIKQLATDPTGESWVSTFEALCAFLYQWNYHIRLQHLTSVGLCEEEAADKIARGFWASINMRPPGRLNLSPRYFPNAIYPPYTSFPHKFLAKEPLWKVAKELHNLIHGVDAQTMAQSTRWIAVQPDKSRIRVDFTFSRGNFTVSQWSAFSMYVGVDFDVDEEGTPVPPTLVGQPYTDVSRVDGLAMIHSTEEESYRVLEKESGKVMDGKPCALDVKLTFAEPLWGILDQCEEFWRYCS